MQNHIFNSEVTELWNRDRSRLCPRCPGSQQRLPQAWLSSAELCPAGFMLLDLVLAAMHNATIRFSAHVSVDDHGWFGAPRFLGVGSSSPHSRSLSGASAYICPYVCMYPTLYLGTYLVSCSRGTCTVWFTSSKANFKSKKALFSISTSSLPVYWTRSD